MLGMFAALASSLTAVELRRTSPALTGAVVAVAFVGTAAGQLLVRRLSDSVQVRIGMALMTVGTAGYAGSLSAASPVLLIVGGLIAGAGAGMLFKQALGLGASLAHERLRGEALAGLLLLGFLGLALVPVGIGIGTLVLPLTTALLISLAVIVAVVLIGGVVLGSEPGGRGVTPRPRRTVEDGTAASAARAPDQELLEVVLARIDSAMARQLPADGVGQQIVGQARVPDGDVRIGLNLQPGPAQRQHLHVAAAGVIPGGASPHHGLVLLSPAQRSEKPARPQDRLRRSAASAVHRGALVDRHVDLGGPGSLSRRPSCHPLCGPRRRRGPARAASSQARYRKDGHRACLRTQDRPRRRR
jgi:hypothetical protein